MSAPTSDSRTTSGRGRHQWWLAAASVVLVGAGVVAWLAQSPSGGGAIAGVPLSSSSAPSAIPVAQPHRAPWVPGAPRHVVIPALGVSSDVLPMKAPGGVLIPPSDPQQLGWWAAGARPGARTGSALVTGHTVHTGGGALDDLETLSRGDRVTVRTDRGTIRYAVRRVSVYSKGRIARDAEELFSQQVPGRLVLITCEDWTGTRYLSNVVVVAVPTSGTSGR